MKCSSCPNFACHKCLARESKNVTVIGDPFRTLYLGLRMFAILPDFLSVIGLKCGFLVNVIAVGAGDDKDPDPEL